MKMTTKEILNHVYDRLECVSKETWITMICKHLTTEDLELMLDNNELTPRFFEDDWCQACEDGTCSDLSPTEEEDEA